MQQDRNGVEFQKIHEYVKLAGKDVLEIGCGNGRVSSMMAPLVSSLVAIDPDEDRLKMARTNVPDVNFRVGKGENLEFADGSFDIVAFTFSLHHQDSAKALAEAHRVLKHLGRVIIIEPANAGDMHPLFRIFRDEDAQISAALDAIEDSDFSLERTETFDIEYIFDDVEEIYGYYFGNYGMAREPGYIESINRALGEKATGKFIRLAETVNIFALVKI